MNALKSFWKHALATLFYSVSLDPEACIGCWLCYEVCPIGCFRRPSAESKIDLCYPGRCIACGACQLQCPTQAARLLRQKP